MIPAHAATQNGGRAAICEVVERVPRSPLPQEEEDERDERDDREHDRQRRRVRDGAKLMPRISAPTSTSDRSPPRLSTGSVPSFTCAGT